jgi:predicted nucleotidyltransferase
MTIVPGIDISTEQIADLCRRYQVREMVLFGSAARGELRPDSDIDVLVELEPGHHLGLFEFDDLQTHLTRIFGRKVDLVSKSGLKPRVRPWVLRDAKIVYAA